MPQSWLAAFPALQQLAAGEQAQLAAHGIVVRKAAGEAVYAPGQSPSHYLMVLDGVVRVQQVSESGREIVLYRVSAGESCTLTTACLLGHEDYPAEAITETPMTAVALPRPVFDSLVGASPAFRQFVFRAFSARITDLLSLVEHIAFGRLDARLAERLLALADSDNVVSATHHQLAAELGSAREAVSRVLAEFQRRGLVQIARGKVTVMNKAALSALVVPPT